jgi:DNA-binding NarL/FixJ family response regulator
MFKASIVSESQPINVSGTQPDVPENQTIESANPIYVGIVASHSLAAHSFFDLIKQNPNMVPIVLPNGPDSVPAFPSDAKSVILIDLWGLPFSAFEYLDHFVVAMPKCAFLASDRARDGIEVARFLRAGFSGFISHDEALHLLGAAIDTIADGRIWTSPEVIRIYMSLTSKRTLFHADGTETLTLREHQVAELLRKRYSNKEMAGFLKISESTVKFHVSNVLMKLNVSDRRDLTDIETFPGPRLCKPSHKVKALRLAPPTVEKQNVARSKFTGTDGAD